MHLAPPRCYCSFRSDLHTSFDAYSSPACNSCCSACLDCSGRGHRQRLAGARQGVAGRSQSGGHPRDRVLSSPWRRECLWAGLQRMDCGGRQNRPQRRSTPPPAVNQAWGPSTPIYFHSPGGSVLGSIELGRLIRARKLEAGVAHTVPFGCDRDKPWEKSCEAQKRSGHELRSEFDPTSAMCNSGCVFALAGGVVRIVPPGIKLGIHDVGFDSARGPLPVAVAVRAKRLVHLQIQEYLRDMGIDQTLFTAVVAVPHNSKRFVEREELVRFGIDRREFGETSWRFIEHPRPAMSKRFFVRVGNEQPQYLNGLVSLDCASRQEIRVVLAREPVASDAPAARLSSISISGRRIGLPYQTSSHDFYIRSARLARHTFDAVEDDTKFEVSGNDLARADEPAGNITLAMDGFSRAFAKLQGSCEQAPPPGQLTVGTSNYSPSTNANCRPGGDQLQCLQGVSGSRSSAGQSPPPNVLPSIPSANVIHTVPIRPDQTRATGYEPEPKQSGAKPSNPVQTAPWQRRGRERHGILEVSSREPTI